jgi:hypothetical protein
MTAVADEWRYAAAAAAEETAALRARLARREDELAAARLEVRRTRDALLHQLTCIRALERALHEAAARERRRSLPDLLRRAARS